MTPACPQCGAEVLDIDVKCGACGAALGSTGAQRMIGQVMLGQYELVDVLGAGGMSVVYKGRHKLTEQEVALKILPPELAAHAQVKSRFVEEAKALAQLDHPNIVHLYNFGQENGSFVLAMQFVSGKTWERLIIENTRLDWVTSVRIACDVLRALEYAHGRGIVHRDMKPSNVLVRDLDGAATVMDFGIAKMTTSTKLTATGQTMGTVRYMSPEQVRGQEVDARTDLYSLGATLYESLVGDTPFEGATHFEIMTKHLSEPPRPPSALGVSVPRAVEDALMRSLAKRADDRFADARDMRKVLEAALVAAGGAPAETQKVSRELLSGLRAPGPGTAPAAPRPVAATATSTDAGRRPAAAAAGERRRRWPWLLAGLAVVAAGAGAAATVLARRGSGGPEPAPRPASRLPEIPGVAIVARKQFPALHLEIATAGRVSPMELFEGYARNLGQLREVATRHAPPIALDEAPLDNLIAVPQAVLCEPSLYLDHVAPVGCSSALAQVADALGRTVVVVDDPATIDAALRAAVGDAVCTFQRVEGEGEARTARIKEICALSADFGAHVAPSRP